MSIHTYFYLGAYIHVPEKTTEIVTTHYICSNSQCSNHQSLDDALRYCPKCGSEGQTNTHKKTNLEHITIAQYEKELSSADMEILMHHYRINKLSELLTEIHDIQKAHVWTLDNIFGKNYSPYDTGVIINEFTPEQITTTLREAENYMSPFLILFNRYYGINLHISFGLVTHFV